MNPNILHQFRLGLYGTLIKNKDALFELSDALLTETNARSLPELSLSPHFRRGWPSIYQALQNGQIDRTELRCLLASFAPGPVAGQRMLIGVDASNIARPSSPTAPDRICLQAHNLPEGGQALTYGWQFSTVVILPDQPSSQTYILDSVRIPSAQTPGEVAAQQLEQLQPLISDQSLLLADRYYGSANFVKLTQHLHLDKLLRVKRNAVFYHRAPGPTGKRGAPHKDGAVFKCADPATWGEADQEWEGLDEKGQSLKVEVWHSLHFKKVRTVELSLFRVTRQGASGKKRDPRVSWFIFIGNKPLALSEVSACYKRRYSQEHGYRFDKQVLLWEKPRLRTPAQLQLWTDLVSAVHDELVLADGVVAALMRPWERQWGQASLTQQRRGLGQIMSELGTPAQAPKVRGKSPGRSFGSRLAPAPRYEVVRKHPKGRKKVKKRG